MKTIKIKIPQTNKIAPIANPLKVGTSNVVKMPKSKKMPDAMDKPSKFFKNEHFKDVKHPTLVKLLNNLEKLRNKK